MSLKLPVSKDRDGAFLAAPLAFAVDILVVGAGLDARAATVPAASDTIVRTVIRGVGVILPGEDFEAGLNRKAAVGGRIIAADASRISTASIFPELVCWDSINQAPVLSRRVRKEPGATTATTLPVCEGPVFDPLSQADNATKAIISISLCIRILPGKKGLLVFVEALA